MSIRMKVDIVGLEGLDLKLNKMNVEARIAVRTQVRKSANAIRKGAQSRVPVDSGRLKKSIRTRFDKDGFGAEIAPGIKWRAHFVEFGTLHQNAHPYMTPAWEENKNAYIAGIKKAIKDSMK